MFYNKLTILLLRVKRFSISNKVLNLKFLASHAISICDALLLETLKIEILYACFGIQWKNQFEFRR